MSIAQVLQQKKRTIKRNTDIQKNYSTQIM